MNHTLLTIPEWSREISLLSKLHETTTLAQELRDKVETTLQEHDLSLRDFLFLDAVSKMETPVRQVDLSDALELNRTTIMHHVDALEEKELLQRTRCPGDRRAHALVLTTRAQKLLSSLTKALS